MMVDNDEVQSLDISDGFHDDRGLNKTWTPECDTKVKPYIGQLFSNINAAFDFYTKYAGLGGFTIRKSTQKKFDDGTVSVKYFVCSKSGSNDSSVSCEVDSTNFFISNSSSTNKSDDDSGKRKRRTMSSKCECDAKMVIKFSGRDGYVISQFFEEHNHELASESEKQFFKV